MGIPTVFVRLTGCPLRCRYCDTTYAFKGGKWMSLAEITSKVIDYDIRHITVTGGEPLAQPACLLLLPELCNRNLIVSLETSGAMKIDQVDPRVITVMDIKTPASGEVEKNHWQNINHLRTNDQVKFVICNREDYLWARRILDEHQLPGRCEVLFSPSFDELEPAHLAEWILKDRLAVRFQLQLHKILWGDVPGR